MEKYTFKNGLVKLNNEIEHDFEEAQNILDLGSHTDVIDAETAYTERENNSFVGTYIVKIQREADYNRFNRMMFNEQWNNREIERVNVSFEEWKNGRLENGQKLGKYLRKKGYSQSLLDFYSQQIKTEKDVYFTISDAPQHVAGMSYYSTGDWDGMGNKSCQCPEIGGRYAIDLAGSLHDDRLFIGMLHDSLSDLENMDDKLKARTVFRMVEIEGIETLLATSYYGNNETKNILDYVLKQMQEVTEIYSNEMIEYNYGISEEIRQPANGSYEQVIIEDIEIVETIEEEIEVEAECPLCNGYGDYTAYTSNDDEIEITCPLCHGDGELERTVYVYEEIEHYEEIERYEEITPYNEMYVHTGYNVIIDVNVNSVRALRENRENEINIEWIEEK